MNPYELMKQADLVRDGARESARLQERVQVLEAQVEILVEAISDLRKKK